MRRGGGGVGGGCEEEYDLPLPYDLAFIIITQEQAKTYIYQKPTQTGENKNQLTKPQMTSTTSITLILYQYSKETNCKKLH